MLHTDLEKYIGITGLKRIAIKVINITNSSIGLVCEYSL
jgi:hypothetical protein